MSGLSLIRTPGLTDVSEHSHFPTVRPFGRHSVFEPYQHVWSSIGVEDESRYVLSYLARTAFQLIVVYYSPIDHSRGRLQSVNGIMFYSPNCSDTVSAPHPSPDRGWEHNPIIDYHKNLSSLVKFPQWWTPCFGWLSFIPKRPVFGGGLLGRLADIQIDEIEGKYSLPQDLINSWKKLEYIICNVITTLEAKYKLPAIGPASPAARGYQRQHAYRSVAHREALASREIFVLWIGLLSFLIAGADTLSKNDWPSLLQNDLRFHPAIADLIRASDLGTFSHEVRRVGAFIYLTKDDIIKTHQPSIHWLIAHNIPIWYQWDEDEIEWAKHDPVFANFGPPQSGGILKSSANRLGSPATKVKTITWREFFKRREENRPRLLNLETALERARRLDRERNPPIKSAKVFVWDRDPELPGREEVFASERIETLEEYGPEQKRYDSYWNEWDCCFEFGRFRTPSPDDMEDEYMDMAPSAYEQTYDDAINILPPEQRCPTPLPDDLYEETDLPPDNFCHGPQSTLSGLISEVQETLALHYGMVLPDLNRVTPGEVLPKEKKFWLRWIGACEKRKLVQVVSQFWQTARGRFFVEFTRQLLNEQPIVCDFDLENSPSFYQRLDSIAIHKNFDSDVPGKYLYVFLFNEAFVTVPWRLAVTTASDALLVCRLNPQYLDADLARFLALRGIPFRTLLAEPLMPPSISCPDVELYLPQRPFGYQFTKADYEAYLNCRSRILRRPRMRAAILRGGYMWRLTIGSVSVDELLEGPVGGGSLLAIDGSLLATDNNEYPVLLDDKLTHNEMDWLCGMYICATGMFLSIITSFSNHYIKSRNRQSCCEQVVVAALQYL